MLGGVRSLLLFETVAPDTGDNGLRSRSGQMPLVQPRAWPLSQIAMRARVRRTNAGYFMDQTRS